MPARSSDLEKMTRRLPFQDSSSSGPPARTGENLRTRSLTHSFIYSLIGSMRNSCYGAHTREHLHCPSSRSSSHRRPSSGSEAPPGCFHGAELSGVSHACCSGGPGRAEPGSSWSTAPRALSGTWHPVEVPRVLLGRISQYLPRCPVMSLLTCLPSLPSRWVGGS